MMRRSLYLLTAAAAAICMAQPASGQTLGVKLGASLANLNVDADDSGADGITGFAGGGFLRFGSGRIGLQFELLSVTKGSDFTDPVGDDDVGIRLEYIEFPALIHVPLTFGTSFTPYVFGGPTVALEAGCDVEFDSTSVDCDDGDVFNRRKTDFGLAAGGGFAFAMGPGAILVEGRYTWGLTNINRTNDGPDIKNRAAYIMAGYMIPLVRGF